MTSFSQYRQEAGLSFDELRELLKLSVEAITDYESGTRVPKPREIQILKGLALSRNVECAKSAVVETGVARIVDGVDQVSQLKLPKRYKVVTDEKAGGATYTPTILADFVARQIVKTASNLPKDVIRILDPAIGDGELLLSVLGHLQSNSRVQVHGFETDTRALERARQQISERFPKVSIHFRQGNFLEFVLDHFEELNTPTFFTKTVSDQFDLVIANPPYVRTQIMGARQAQMLAHQFGLAGRVDLYYAFVMAMARVLKPQGVAGIIVSNRFMTTRSGAAVRKGVRKEFNIRHVWDLGDTKIFNAAVLPCVMLLGGKNGHTADVSAFSSIYETKSRSDKLAIDPVAALEHEGVISLPDGRNFCVRHGKLDAGGRQDAIWRIQTKAGSAWLETVAAHTWRTFREIGKIRVGVKTCADSIFIRYDWEAMPKWEQPELLRSLTTHHIARQFRALKPEKDRRILYPHEMANSKRCVIDLDRYPRTAAYLERHRSALEARRYVTESGRKWYEIWVPQDPSAWEVPKLVFRDISAEPSFWIDNDATIVNGDFYWIAAERRDSEDLLWLAAAVGNSTFSEAFYDHRFHNKLYAGRRRFITQYVEQFPLPNPAHSVSRQIVAAAKEIFGLADSPMSDQLKCRLNCLVWEAFGLPVEEVSR